MRTLAGRTAVRALFLLTACGLPQQPGAVVVDVQPGGPAAQAGVQPKDVITAVDGAKLTSESDLARILSDHKPDDSVALTVARGEGTQDIKVTLGAPPAP